MSSGCRVLVIGRSGQLATELARANWPAGWQVTCTGTPELDLRQPEQAASAVTAAAPDIVVNAAAYTDVEKAESEPAMARLVNAIGPAAIARSCAALGAPFITISTDYVFDGSKPQPYSETDTVNPTSAYGRSKAEGEALVREALAQHVILRTSWVFSPFGTNFVKTMRRLGGERPLLRVVDDQRGCPTAAADLARAVVMVCNALMAGGSHTGTFHVANKGATSWHGFAAAIFEGLAARGEAIPQQLVPITTAEYPTKTKRPANSVLDCTRFEQSFGLVMRPWRDALSDCLDELAGKPRAGTAGR